MESKRASQSKGARLDPRPLSQKQYQLDSQKYVADYVKQLHPDTSFTYRNLQNPSAKDFAYVVSVLINSIDPTYSIEGKLDEEIPKLFKRLGYPFPLHKHAFLAVGAPSSWPVLLGALTWLTDLAKYLEQVAVNWRAQGEEPKEDGLKPNQMMRAYERFLKGEDFADEIEEWRRDVQRKAEEMTSEMNMMKIIIPKLKREKKALLDARVNVTALDKENEMLRQHIACLSNRDHYIQRKHQLQQELAKCTQEDTAAVAALEAKKKHLAELKQAMARQKYSAEEVDCTQQKFATLEQSLVSLRQEMQEVQAVKWEFEQQLNERIDTVEVQVHNYNLLATELVNCPVQLHIDRLHTLHLDENQLLSPAKFLETLTSQCETLQSNLEEKLAEVTKEQQQWAQLYEDKKEQVNTVRTEVSQLKEAIEKRKTASEPQGDSVLEQLKAEAVDIDLEVEELGESIADVSHQIQVRQELNETLKREIRDINELADEEEAVCVEMIERARSSLKTHFEHLRLVASELVQWSAESSVDAANRLNR